MDMLNETITTISEIMKKIIEFNSTPTGNESITKTLTSVAEWIATLTHEDHMEVYTPFIQVVNDFKSHNDLNKIIKPLLYATESIKDYDFPDAQKQMDKVYQLIKVDDINNFDGLIQYADSLTHYMKDRNRSRPYYQAAENKISSVKDAIRLACALTDVYEDKEWARKIYHKAQELANTYQDFYDISMYSGGTFNDFAHQNLLTAYKKISQSSDEIYKKTLVGIAESLMDFGKDTANAQKVVRDYLDNYATSLVDYTAVFVICGTDDYLNDMSLSQEVLSKAKALCKTYSDYNKLLNEMEFSGDFFSQNFSSFAKEVVTKFENNTQKEAFIDDFEISLDKSFLTEVKNSSIEALKQKYGSSGANNFDEELILDEAPKVTPESDLKSQYAAKIVSGENSYDKIVNVVKSLIFTSKQGEENIASSGCTLEIAITALYFDVLIYLLDNGSPIYRDIGLYIYSNNVEKMSTEIFDQLDKMAANGCAYEDTYLRFYCKNTPTPYYITIPLRVFSEKQKIPGFKRMFEGAQWYKESMKNIVMFRNR